jgi:hypothetical protein
MASKYYTPFMAQAGRAIGQGLADRGARQRKEQQNELAGSAYMGDPKAMQELMQLNPQLGVQIQQQVAANKRQTSQDKLSTQSAKIKIDQASSEELKRIASQAIRMPYEQAKPFMEQQLASASKTYPGIAQLMAGDDGVIDEAEYNQFKTVYGASEQEQADIAYTQAQTAEKTGESGGAFEGTGMPAQISNALVKGANDPEYRKTPEYARAWDMANKPNIIDTEEGRIPLYPTIDPMFKPPNDNRTEVQEISDINETAKEDTKIIEGTEKTKTTADEKVSLGFFNRMTGAEESIKGLGEFDSASVWEQAKGITNITASSELQQYRQAADDWIRAKLRRESGAVIGPQEMEKEYEIYFPRIGDSQAVIDQKGGARKEAMRSMKTAAGRAFKKTDKPEETKKVEVPDVGFVSKGYEFLGGDPSDKASWRKQ